MKRSITFDLPPSPRCVIQKHVVILSTADAQALFLDLLAKLAEVQAVPLGYFHVESAAGEEG